MPSPTLRGTVTLVLGGARSGKSRHAEELAAANGRDLIYIATAAAHDDEMGLRIAEHRARRNKAWRTIDAPVELASALDVETGPAAIVLVDCLTLWLTNLMLGEHDVEKGTSALLSALARVSGPVILVSNEVGYGIVPDNALARAFRDAQGRLNQRVAALADRVTLVAAGIPIDLKPQKEPHH